jgi:signal transduction histidine kinase
MILQLLIVDDDVSLCHHLKTFFERQHYKVEIAHDGPSAVATCEKFRPHLMFLDIGLPGMSGIDVLKHIKDKDPAVRVIMITGQTENELIRQARILGADDYITKPFTLEYLSGEVMNKLHKQLFYELRTTSADLAIEKEKAELLFEQVEEGIMLFDAQGLVFIANPVARKTLGLPENTSSLTAARAFEAFRSDPPTLLQKLDDAIGKKFDLLRDTPKKLVLECRVNTINSRKKERFGYLLIFRDVTEERRAETAMHRFISLVSHKLRTPLVTIRAYPRLLLSENNINPLSDFQKNALQVIAKQCRRMEDMVNQLIAFSSLDPQEMVMQPVSIADLLSEAEKVLPDDISIKKEQMHIEEGLSKLYVNVDPTVMQHAFRNLMENAFKFGGKDLHVKGVATNGSVTVRFIDNGPGIPPEDQDRVFERFYQVEKDFSGQVPGAGLGLTMVKQTVESHGGKIHLESVIGQGTTFIVTLPSVNPRHANG